jgi:tripartite-type tricarboxylate transporter receptor subunit TctC
MAPLNYASAGIGGVTHVAGKLFKMLAGIGMRHVPYRGGGPALTDLLGGQVQIYFSQMAGTIEYIRAGTLHPRVPFASGASRCVEPPAAGLQRYERN